MRKVTGVALAAALLCSCADDGMGSLKAELAKSVEQLRGDEPPPLPAMWPATRIRYEAGRLPDPFYPERR